MVAPPADDPTTEELKAVQSQRERREREAEREAPTAADEQTHRRRADKAAYLQEKLDEQERAEDS